MNDNTHTYIQGLLPTINLGGLSLPSYNIYISILLCGLIIYTIKRADKKDMSATTALDLFLMVMIGGSIGARLFHIFYEAPDYYKQNPYDIFYFWQGGFVYYGGLIFGFLSGWLTLRYKGESFPRWLDFFAPIISLGSGLGRISCFLAGCCYGSRCDLPWAFGFKEVSLLDGSIQLSYRHPTQLYSCLMEMGIFAILITLERKIKLRPGVLFSIWVLLHSIQRIVMEFFRDDNRGYFLGHLSVSTWISLIFILLSLLWIFRKKQTAW